MMLFLLMLIACAEACPGVTFVRRVINIIGDGSSCKFKLNGGEKVASLNEIKLMRFYGYVMMDCSDCSKGIVSNFNGCDDCIWCTHNESIESCKSTALPIVVAVVITILMTLITTLVFLKFKLVSKMLASVERLATTHKKNKIMMRKKQAMRNLKYQVQVDSDEQLEGPLCPEAAQYLELPGPSSDKKLKAPTTSGSQNAPTLPPRPRAASFNKSKAAVGLAMIMTGNLAKACDVTSYVSSENKIYTDDSFKTLYTGLYHMTDKQTLCMKYLDGKVDKIIVSSTSRVDTFTPIYRTADFKMDVVNAPWRCYTAGGCGYNKCLANSVYEDWVGEETKTGTITEYGCKQGNDYCTFCSYYGQCKWYKYTLSPKGSIYTVYKKFKSDWNVKLIHISSDGTVSGFVFSSGMITTTTTSGTRITVMSPVSTNFLFNDYLLESPEGCNMFFCPR